MTNKPPRPITREDLERLGEPLKSQLWPLKYTGPYVGAHTGRSPTGRITYTAPARQFLRQTQEARHMVDAAARKLREAGAVFIDFDYAEIEARVMAHVLDVNPTPYYSYLCSAMTLTAVYKAHRACEAVPSFDASYFAAHEWRNLSYATERGIVFG